MNLKSGYALRSPAYAPHMPSTRFDIAPWLPATDLLDGAVHRGPIDIIIPVYRGLTQTQRCLNSVLADRERPDAALL